MNSKTITESSSLPSRGRSCQKEARLGRWVGGAHRRGVFQATTDTSHLVCLDQGTRRPLLGPTVLAMKRVLAYLIGFGFVFAAIFANAAVLERLVGSTRGDVTEPSTITDYQADFVVDEDGDIHVTETLTIDGLFTRHGIFRFLDRADPTAPSTRRDAVRRVGDPATGRRSRSRSSRRSTGGSPTSRSAPRPRRSAWVSTPTSSSTRCTTPSSPVRASTRRASSTGS